MSSRLGEEQSDHKELQQSAEDIVDEGNEPEGENRNAGGLTASKV